MRVFYLSFCPWFQEPVCLSQQVWLSVASGPGGFLLSISRPRDPHCADLPGRSGQIFFRSTWPTT